MSTTSYYETLEVEVTIAVDGDCQEAVNRVIEFGTSDLAYCAALLGRLDASYCDGWADLPRGAITMSVGQP